MTVTSSATVVCKTPMFLKQALDLGPILEALLVKTYPLSKPPRALAINATVRFVENPNMSTLSPVPASPVKRTGFRPILSLSRPQRTPVENSAKVNADVTKPA